MMIMQRSPDGHVRLTEGQRRRLQVVFRSLLAEARELLDWCAQPAERRDNPRPDWISAVADELVVLIDRVRQTAATLDIPVETLEISPEHHVAGWSATWWSAILDCRPSALRAYGAVDSEVRRVLEPAVAEMAKRLLRMKSVAEKADASSKRRG